MTPAGTHEKLIVSAAANYKLHIAPRFRGDRNNSFFDENMNGRQYFSIKRIIGGYLISPAAAVLFGAILIQLLHKPVSGAGGLLDIEPRMDPDLMFGYCLLMTPVAYLGGLLFGLPTCLALMKLGIARFWAYIPFGCSTGLLTMATWFTIIRLINKNPSEPVFLSFFPCGILQPSLCGIVGICVFWWIVVRERLPQPSPPEPKPYYGIN